MTLDELIENFSSLTDWEDKYRYLLDLGATLPSMPAAEKNSASKVDGCMAQVWITANPSPSPSRGEGRGRGALHPSVTRHSSLVTRSSHSFPLQEVAQNKTPAPTFTFNMDSDAHIVRGLQAILWNLINNKTATEIRALPLIDIFEKLGLQEHLSMNRRNGFSAMVNRINELIDGR